MTLAIVIAAWLIVGLVAGFFFGRDIWRNGNSSGPSYDRYPPHDLSQSLWAFFGMLLAWPLFFLVVGAYMLFVGVKKVGKRPVERLAHRLWD